MCKHGLGGLIRYVFEDLLQKRMIEQLLGVGGLLVALEQVDCRHQRCPKPWGRLIGGGTGGLTGGAWGFACRACLSCSGVMGLKYRLAFFMPAKSMMSTIVFRYSIGETMGLSAP